MLSDKPMTRLVVCGLIILLTTTTIEAQRYRSRNKPGKPHPAVDTYCQRDTPLPTRINGTCASCQSRCGQVTSLMKSSKYCSCDEFCAVYGDCCEDITRWCRAEYRAAEQKRREHPQWKSKCYSWKNEVGRGQYSHFINTCPDSQEAFHLDSLHTIRANDDVDLNKMVPVYDRDLDVTFVNLKCAKCNGRRNLVPWKPMLNCVERAESGHRILLSSHNTNTTIKTSQQLRALLGNFTCVFKFKPPSMNLQLHNCEQTVDSCPATCQNDNLVRKCEGHFQSYSSAGFSFYKNYYCGLCNLAEIDDPKPLVCGELPAVRPSVLESKPLEGFSLSMIMDFNPEKGLKVPADCGKNMVWVASEQACRKGTCPEGMSLSSEGTCVAIYENNVNARFIVKFTTALSWDLPRIKRQFPDLEFAIRDSIMSLVPKTTDHDNIVVVTSDLDSFVFRSGNQLNFTSIVDVKYYTTKDKVSSPLDTTAIGEVVERETSRFFRENAWYFTTLTVFNTKTSMSSAHQLNEKLDCHWVTYALSEVKVTGSSLTIVATGHVYKEGDFMKVNNSMYVCVSTAKPKMTSSSVLGIITIIFTTISILCMLVRLVLQFFVEYYNTFPGWMQFNLVLALTLAFFFLLMSPLVVEVGTACIIMASLKHWTFLASFCWMNCVALDTWLLFRSSKSLMTRDESSSSLKYYIIYGWGVPFLIAVIVLGLEFADIDHSFQAQYSDSRACWFSQKIAMLIYFVAPVACCLLVNIILFSLIIHFLRQSFKSSLKMTKTSETKKQFLIYLRLFVLMGLSWILGFVAVLANEIVMWYIFVIVNASQGIYILIAFVCTKNVWNSLTKKGKRPISTTDRTSRSGSITRNQSTKSTTVSTGAEHQYIPVEQNETEITDSSKMSVVRPKSGRTSAPTDHAYQPVSQNDMEPIGTPV